MAGLPKADELDCSHRARGVWLVKVPKYVAEAWDKVAGDAEAAKLRIEKTPGMKPNVSLTLSEAAMSALNMTGATATSSQSMNRAKAVPRDYKLAVATMSAQTLAIFSQSESILSGKEGSLGSLLGWVEGMDSGMG
ncbi:unnamed protein product [Notodromas monacha]|uniref:General transcription factor IIF subunit 2 n=1 Tax=Notodromas monacha TaxID=399045 RepID=A0A7R9BE30_9CRUS|nr:unnamed protein product [Notodromas monacha]CAG0912452.1 unnamed protein product [Notodromas monacha]